MYKRLIESKIIDLSKSYRCLTFIGPRQSGKTTLAKNLFKSYQYFTFESPDVRDQFVFDPRGFLSSIKKSAIFDEVQKVPELLSYLQEILDNKNDKRKFILTGSNNLKLSQHVSQTLAGRTKILNILPLSYHEISEKDKKHTIDEALYYGLYPRIFDESLNPTDWLSSYFQTYVEKDIREVINISDLRLFNNFIRILAGRVGQLVNYNSISSDIGVSQPTIKSWLSSLETTFICFTLNPHYKNFNKRIIKSPKVYFYDVGLLCYLLRINNVEQLKSHPLRGQIFENWVIVESIKGFTNKAEEHPYYFWRDQHGHEIDLVKDNGVNLELIEIKISKTFHKEFLQNMDWLNNVQGSLGGTCIYGGSERLNLKDYHIIPWNVFSR